MNEVKEKLMELLASDDCPLLYIMGVTVEGLADYLIANGVTIQTADKPSAVAYNLSPTESKWIPVTERMPKEGLE